MSTPDAVLMPPGSARGANIGAKIDSVLAVAEPLLGVDRPSGERGYIHRQPGDVLFVSKDPHDTLNHPNASPEAGKSRYRWERRADGVQLGYLKHD